MPWTSQRNFLSLHNFPKQNLRVKMYHSAPRRLGFNLWTHHHINYPGGKLQLYNDLTWTTLILKATHVCMLPTNRKRKGMFKHMAVRENYFQFIHSSNLKYTKNMNAECSVSYWACSQKLAKYCNQKKRHLTLVYSDCHGFFKSQDKPPPPNLHVINNT